MGWKVKIDDMGNPLDVDSAGRDIGGHKDPNFTVFEVLKGTRSLVLAAVGMEGSGSDSITTELLGHAVGSVLGSGEDENRVHLVVFQKVPEKIGFLGLGNLVNKLLDGIGGVGSAADLNGLGLVLKFVGELLDFTRKGGREKKGLPVFLREVLDDAADVGKKAHVEHPVGFVEDEKFKAGKIGASLIHQIHQTTWGGNDKIDPAAQSLLLRTFPHPAIYGSHPKRDMLGVGFHVVVNLDNQFTGWRDDQSTGLAAT
jgi:hypothetical protein